MEESSYSYSMSMYNIDYGREDLEVPSCRSPTLIEDQLPENQEEVHSSPTMEKILSKRHSVKHKEENPLSYNIEEIFEAFSFNLYKKEFNRKRVLNEIHNDGSMKEIQEEEVLFKNTNEYLVIVATTSTTLSKAIAHNVTVLNEKLSQVESDNNKLKDEIISLKEEMNKRRKVECDMTLLKESILEQQEKLHDVNWNDLKQSKRWTTK